jgi:hypothetical protein
VSRQPPFLYRWLETLPVDMTFARYRVALHIARSADFDDGGNARPTYARLAEMAHTSRRTVARTITMLRERGLIEQTGWFVPWVDGVERRDRKVPIYQCVAPETTGATTGGPAFADGVPNASERRATPGGTDTYPLRPSPEMRCANDAVASDPRRFATNGPLRRGSPEWDVFDVWSNCCRSGQHSQLTKKREAAISHAHRRGRSEAQMKAAVRFIGENCPFDDDRSSDLPVILHERCIDMALTKNLDEWPVCDEDFDELFILPPRS